MWFRLRRLLSYIIPLSSTVPSAVNGSLEVTWYKGRKMLDTRHANYSYGLLHSVLRYGLLFVAPAQAERALLLGLGGGSAVQLLHEAGFTGHLTAIDLDPAVIQVADTEFDVRPGEQLAIVCADAFEWVRTAREASFDLVIVDLFLDLTLPTELQTAAFWHDIRRVLLPGGRVLFNTLVDTPQLVEGLEIADYLAELGFGVKDVEVGQVNRLLILKN